MLCDEDKGVESLHRNIKYVIPFLSATFCKLDLQLVCDLIGE